MKQLHYRSPAFCAERSQKREEEPKKPAPRGSYSFPIVALGGGPAGRRRLQQAALSSRPRPEAGGGGLQQGSRMKIAGADRRVRGLEAVAMADRRGSRAANRASRRMGRGGGRLGLASDGRGGG